MSRWMIWVPPTYSIKLLFEDDVVNVRLVEGDERLSNCKNREKNYETSEMMGRRDNM